MDYCHPCRRHLNGALACPGCGTSVEDLHPYADDADAHPEEVEETSPEPADEPGPRASRRRADRERAVGTRSNRRDRKAAAHRRRRKRVLLIGSGLLLAVGALSLTELGMESPGSGPATNAADDKHGGGASASPDGGAAERDDTAEGSGADASPSASPSKSASPSASESEKDDKDEDEAEKEKERDGQSATTGSRPDASPSA
uniref:SCO2400 family protein n=1 Tax=Streptomyces caniscabiei TaxID=2746961 RepID=UPI0015C50E6B